MHLDTVSCPAPPTENRSCICKFLRCASASLHDTRSRRSGSATRAPLIQFASYYFLEAAATPSEACNSCRNSHSRLRCNLRKSNSNIYRSSIPTKYSYIYMHLCLYFIVILARIKLWRNLIHDREGSLDKLNLKLEKCMNVRLASRQEHSLSVS